MDETEELEAKVWKIEKPDAELAIASGAELLERLKATGTGDAKIEYALSFFERDEDTGDLIDLPAKKLAKKFFKPEDGVEFTDVTKQKVKDLVETGTWVEKPHKKTDPTSVLAAVKRIAKAEAKKAEAKRDEKK